MNKETIENVNTQKADVGFHSIHLEAAHNITIKRGLYVKCNATFSVNNGTLYIVSENDSITLALPQVSLDTVEIDTTYDSVKCDGLTCNQLTISAAHNVKIENSQINECEISSEYDSVHIMQSTIDNLSISAAHNVSVEVNDFSKIDIESEYDGVIIKYNGNQLVNLDCTSTHGTVKAIGAFYGDVNCAKKIVINAAHSIKLISGK